MFSHTPRDIREMTKPPYFEYAIGESWNERKKKGIGLIAYGLAFLVIVNLLFITAVGLIYAPLAPLVAMGACCVFWFSSVVVRAFLEKKKGVRADNGDSTSTSCCMCTFPERRVGVGCGTCMSIDFWHAVY